VLAAYLVARPSIPRGAWQCGSSKPRLRDPDGYQIEIWFE
jgi:hypothetical protein